MFATPTKTNSPAKAKPNTEQGGADKTKRQINPICQTLASNSLVLQPKLMVSQPNDLYEQEADRVADRVMRMAAPSAESVTTIPAHKLQRKCTSCEEEQPKPQRKAEVTSQSVLPNPAPITQALKTSGQPLDNPARFFMEQRFGQKFEQVRVHSGASAAESARAINARAYTVGKDIVFGNNQYSTSTDDGKRLLAHELAHTIQQSDNSPELVQRDQPTPADLVLQGVGQLPPPRPEDFCQPWPSVEEARRVHQIALQFFVPALSGQFGTEVGSLWRSYLSRRHGAPLTRRVFSDPANRITQAFSQSETIRNRQNVLMPRVEEWFRRTCPTIPANFPFGVPAAQIFTAAELNDPINFNIPSEIPGHIAGGVGSSDAGPDTRRMGGSVNFFKSTDADGRTTAIRARSELQFVVDDAIDFCPGDPGTGLEQMLTTPLSRLEKSGETWPAETFAYDVPFEVRFTGEPVSSDFSPQTLRTCDSNARPTLPPQAPRGPEPSPPPTEDPGRQPIFRKATTDGIQSKSTVSDPGDPAEQAADRIADHVLRTPTTSTRNALTGFPFSSAANSLPAAQRKCASCEEEGEQKLNRSRADGVDNPSPGIPQAAYRGMSSAGQPLDTNMRSLMEARLPYDFGQVRTHTDAEAAESARMLGARAYTVNSNIVFGRNQFAPETNEGQRLIAHELVHVIQQGAATQDTSSHEQSGRSHEARSLPISASSARISRVPWSTETMHAELVEQYRTANGFPPHGVDPLTGAQVGPTDAEIRFGGLLNAWLARQNRTVPAPSQTPSIAARGTTNVVAGCANAPDIGACRIHQNYVQNTMPQTISNIRNVRSPYSAAIADLYGATLPAARTAAAPMPPGSPTAQFGRSVPASAPGPVTVTFGATTFTFNTFEVSLQQQPGGANGQALGIGTPTAFIFLNEKSNSALLGDLAAIEATMVHEMMHIFMAIVEAQNLARTPGSPLTDRNLDRASYANVQTALETALLPFITQIRQLPSFAQSPPPGTAQGDATSTARSFLSEAIARAEAGIFSKQRAGQAFTPADLQGLPAFFHTADYWFPNPPVWTELRNFITTNQTQIDAAIKPLIVRAGEVYLNLRP